jgi:hypothetical protein
MSRGRRPGGDVRGVAKSAEVARGLMGVGDHGEQPQAPVTARTGQNVEAPMPQGGSEASGEKPAALREELQPHGKRGQTRAYFGAPRASRMGIVFEN